MKVSLSKQMHQRMQQQFRHPAKRLKIRKTSIIPKKEVLKKLSALMLGKLITRFKRKNRENLPLRAQKAQLLPPTVPLMPRILQGVLVG